MKKTARKIITAAVTAALLVGGTFAAVNFISVSPEGGGDPYTSENSGQIEVTLDIDFSEIYFEKNYAKLSADVKNNAGLPESGSFADDKEITVTEGASALDVLKGYCSENGIALDVRFGGEALGMSDYVCGIGGLSERDCTRHSGWIYLINGIEPDVPMSETIMENGQRLEVRYIVY